MSPPAENAFPAPVNTIARTSSSASSSRITSGSSRKNAWFIALNLSGRLMVTSAVPSPRRAISKVSMSAILPTNRLAGNFDPMRAVLDAYFAGINSERYADVAALFAPGGVLVAPGVKPRTGPAEIAAYFDMVLERYPVHHDQPTRTLIDGTTATVEIDFTGELATGASLTFEAVDVFDLDAEGRITKLVTWYDSHLVRARLTDAEAQTDENARTRAALREVRRGEAVELSGIWKLAPAAPLAARAVTENPRPGDVLLVHGDAELDTLENLAAVIATGTLTGTADFPHGDGWDLAGATRGLFVSIGPGAALWT